MINDNRLKDKIYLHCQGVIDLFSIVTNTFIVVIILRKYNKCLLLSTICWDFLVALDFDLRSEILFCSINPTSTYLYNISKHCLLRWYVDNKWKIIFYVEIKKNTTLVRTIKMLSFTRSISTIIIKMFVQIIDFRLIFFKISLFDKNNYITNTKEEKRQW